MLTEDQEEQIQKWIEQGRYKTREEFIKAAVETLLMAEKLKDSFTQSIQLE